MNNNILKAVAMLSLTAFSLNSFAGYNYFLKLEEGAGGLPKGSIAFVEKSSSTPPVNNGGNEGGTGTDPETPEVPEEPKEKRELLYSTPLNHYLTTSSEFLFNHTSLPGTPLECGVITSSCVKANHTNGSVSFRYTGHNANYSSSFYIPDLIIIKTSYYNSSTECKLSGTTSAPWSGDGENFTMTYNCGAGNLPAPLAPPYTADHNSSTSFGFSAEFYKVTK